MSDNPLLRDLTPHLPQRGRFRPEPGARIAITLPGEVVAGIVIKVVTADTLIVQLGPVFFSKAAAGGYRAGAPADCHSAIADSVIADRVAAAG